MDVLGHRAGSPAMVFVTVCIAQFMAPFMLTAVGVAYLVRWAEGRQPCSAHCQFCKTLWTGLFQGV